MTDVSAIGLDGAKQKENPYLEKLKEKAHNGVKDVQGWANGFNTNQLGNLLNGSITTTASQT